VAEQTCPPWDDLSAFVLGKLPEVRLGAVARHLDECPLCEAEVASLERQSDDLLTGLRRTGAVDGAASRQVEVHSPALLGDYRILREVGRGGMGIVYEAEQVSLGRRVALKVLPRQFLLGNNAADRFRREARAVARLHHTNIVQVYGTGEQDGLHYFVMQLIKGAGLDQVVRSLRRHRSSVPSTSDVEEMAVERYDQESISAIVRRLIGRGHDGEAGEVTAVPGKLVSTSAREHHRHYWEHVARIGLQVAEALAFAHSRGVLHRDVKPSNLLLDQSGQAWLADFGLAKEVAETENLTASGVLIGTLRYVPPERLQGQSDARGDVYGLGISLYELLTLSPAFSECDRSNLLHQILQTDPPRPRRLNAAVPRDLETSVLKAVARDPKHRYQTAAAMALDLQLFLEDRPIKARRVSQAEMVWRWCRRSPVQAGLVSAFLLTLILGSAGISWKWWEAETQRGKAETEKLKARIAERQMVNERDAADRARDDSSRVLAGVMLDQGITQAEHGDVAGGLFWMLEGLRAAPTEDSALARVIRTNLAGWMSQAPGLRAMIERPSDVFQCAFSPDSRVFLTVSADGVQAWDAATGGQLGLHLEAREPVSFSPNGKMIVTGNGKANDKQGQAQRWDAQSGQPIGNPLFHPHKVTSLVFSPDGKRLATGSTDGIVRIWDSASGKLQSEAIRHEKVAIRSLDWSPDGKFLGVGTDPGELPGAAAAAYLWDPATAKQAGPPLAHQGSIGRLVFSPDGQRLLTGSWDGGAHLWDVATSKPVASPLRIPTGGLSARFTPDG
jgi:serine/threonine protein kinase